MSSYLFNSLSKSQKIFTREGKLIDIIYLDFGTAFDNIRQIDNEIQKDQGERQFVDMDKKLSKKADC